jgi:trimethylamine--corrinoid protein Co-methyltransferase
MGMLELGVTWSHAQLVMDNEIARMIKRVVQGIPVNDDTLAVDIIKKVGVGNNFLGEKHTRQFMGSEQSTTKLIDRRMRGTWMSRGGKDMTQNANEIAISILENHKPDPLPESVLKKFKEIIAEAEEPFKK